jgi:adenine deaminase
MFSPAHVSFFCRSRKELSMNNMNGMHPINEPSDPAFLQTLIRTARGRQKAGLVIKNSAYLNVFTGEWLRGDIAVCGKFIAGIGEYAGETEIDATSKTCVPGFIDGHIHLESAMVTPLEFARAVLPRGTTAVIADPHEIANVLGTAGIDYMLSATEDLPLDVFFMMPSCVPATRNDENGAAIGLRKTAGYLKHLRVLGLGEMMDYSGVLNAAPHVLRKISAAHAVHKKVDGHAPGLHGKDLNAYIAAGINTDHECVSAEEAYEKLRLGQWIMIREGTAGRNLTALLPLFRPPYSARCLMVTDDKHPGDLINLGHIDHMVRKAITLGADPAVAYTIASHNAAQCFHLNRLGAIAPGCQADFLLLDDVDAVAIHSVYKAGKCVFSKGFGPALPDFKDAPPALHAVNIGDITESSFLLGRARVIGLIPGELITTDEGYADAPDAARDIIKIAVVERHRGTGHMGKAYLKGYGLHAGAIATSVAHDAHNLIVAGVSDADMALAVHRIACMQGGMVIVSGGNILAELPLPIAGLMCPLPATEVHQVLSRLTTAARTLGVSTGIDPFMTLSFVSLPVIPALRLTTRGVAEVGKTITK